MTICWKKVLFIRRFKEYVPIYFLNKTYLLEEEIVFSIYNPFLSVERSKVYFAEISIYLL